MKVRLSGIGLIRIFGCCRLDIHDPHVASPGNHYLITAADRAGVSEPVIRDIFLAGHAPGASLRPVNHELAFFHLFKGEGKGLDLNIGKFAYSNADFRDRRGVGTFRGAFDYVNHAFSE